MMLLHVLLIVAAMASTLPAQTAAERIARVEKGLRPRVQVAGEPEVRWTIAARQAEHKTPAVSVAVLRGGEIAWAQAWGATPDTLFQAASISKPVAAVTALRLVADGKLSLDEDVNVKLKSWKVPANSFGKPVTLRMLLSHTAGLTVHGFPGYAEGAEVPKLTLLLDGTKPANTAPIRVDIEPGTKFRYSGGGYEVMQQLIEDVTGKPFAEVAKALVLQPAGMAGSTYEQPLPQKLHSKAAVANGRDGMPIKGRWHTYPEQAAAGLWTTPSDLARFLIAVRSGKLLPAKLTDEMLTAVRDGYGLGWQVSGKRYAHGGSNEGYRCFAVAWRDSGDGAVVMTNSDRGNAVADELLRSISAEYQWTDYRVETKTAVTLTGEQLASILGSYDAAGSVVEATARPGGGFKLATPMGVVDFMPESPTRFFPLSDGVPTLVFEKNAEGVVTGFAAGNMRGTRKVK